MRQTLNDSQRRTPHSAWAARVRPPCGVRSTAAEAICDKAFGRLEFDFVARGSQTVS